MSSIQVVGHVCVDLTPRLGSGHIAAPGELAEVGPMAISIGGAVGNCGRTLAALGVDVSLSAAVGDDELGATCLRLLRRRHGDAVDLAVTPDHATSYSVVVEPLGQDRSFWHHTGANDTFVGECDVTARHLVHFGYPTLMPGICADNGAPLVRLFGRAHAQGVATSLDLAYLATNSPLRSRDWTTFFRAVLPVCDVFCPSWDDLTSSLGILSGGGRAAVAAWARTFLEWGAAVVLITLGSEGSYLATGTTERLGALGACGIDPRAWADREIWLAAEALADVVTTNGAGDTFKAAFLARLAQGADPQECLEFAHEVVGRHLRGQALTAS